jgi:ATP adenylyltransferase
MKYNHDFRSSHALSRFQGFRELWDTPLFESANFLAVPTLGALLEGWLLIVPRKPLLSFAEVPCSWKPELNDFLSEVASVLVDNYGPVSLFEHGPKSLGSSLGCGVDYAHVHLVPFCCDLVEAAARLEPGIEWMPFSSATEAWSISQNEEYWIAQNEFGKGRCYRGTLAGKNAPSQLFRRVIASHLRRPEDFDWKAQPELMNISATVERITSNRMAA